MYSGTALDLVGKPVAGAVVVLNGTGDSVRTAGDGSWSLARTTGIALREKLVVGTRHLLAREGGRLRLAFSGGDALGRGARPGVAAPSTGLAARAAGVADTLVVRWKGKRLVRMPSPGKDSTGIKLRLDTAWSDDGGIAWNPGVCYGSLFDRRDGRTYRTIQMWGREPCGTGSWRDAGMMAENLAYAVPGSVCYGGSSDSCAKYGRLYSWGEALGLGASGNVSLAGAKGRRQGICPDGWVVPDLYAADTTYDYRGRSRQGWLGDTVTVTVDRNGFRGLPSGYQTASGGFADAGQRAYLWSMQENAADTAMGDWFDQGTPTLHYERNRVRLAKAARLAIRCRHAYRDTLVEKVQVSAGVMDEVGTPSMFRTDTVQVLRFPDGGSATVTFSAKAIHPESVLRVAGATGPWTLTFTKDTTVAMVASLGAGTKTTPLRVVFRDQAFPGWNPKVTYGTVTDARDGRSYRTVQVGTRTWMAENLAVDVNGSVCAGGTADSCARYGRQYTWTQALGISDIYLDSGLNNYTYRQGLCPTGWHVPLSHEWSDLETQAKRVLGADSVAWGRALALPSGYSDLAPQEDRLGMRLLPAGSGMVGEPFVDQGTAARFWIAQDVNNAKASVGGLMRNKTDWVAAEPYVLKRSLLSVRCVR
jgi:uncharacterized protein (TIGR02145 family)